LNAPEQAVIGWAGGLREENKRSTAVFRFMPPGARASWRRFLNFVIPAKAGIQERYLETTVSGRLTQSFPGVGRADFDAGFGLDICQYGAKM